MDVKPPGQRGPGAAPSLPHVRGCLGVSSASRRPPWWFPGRGDTAGLLPGRQESDHRDHRATGITGDQTIPSRHWTARKPRPRTPRTGANTLHQPPQGRPRTTLGAGKQRPKTPRMHREQPAGQARESGPFSAQNHCPQAHLCMRNHTQFQGHRVIRKLDMFP